MSGKFSLVLLSGGTGTRMKEHVPKQYLFLAGKPVIVHILEYINKVNEIEEVIICANPIFFDLINDYLKNYNLKVDKFKIVKSGETRQETVYNGVLKAENENIILHEAARPFVQETTFVNLIREAEETATYGVAIPFTVLKGCDTITGILNRDELINIQLPQKFKRNDLMKAFTKAFTESKKFTEEASMIKYYFADKFIKVLEGSQYNLKITYPLDLKFGEIILNNLLNREDY